MIERLHVGPRLSEAAVSGGAPVPRGGAPVRGDTTAVQGAARGESVGSIPGVAPGENGPGPWPTAASRPTAASGPGVAPGESVMELTPRRGGVAPPDPDDGARRFPRHPDPRAARMVRGGRHHAFAGALPGLHRRLGSALPAPWLRVAGGLAPPPPGR